jgi:hypothetical protein
VVFTGVLVTIGGQTSTARHGTKQHTHASCYAGQCRPANAPRHWHDPIRVSAYHVVLSGTTVPLIQGRGGRCVVDVSSTACEVKVIGAEPRRRGPTRCRGREVEGVGTELRWRWREPTADATTPSSPPFKMKTECSVPYQEKDSNTRDSVFILLVSRWTLSLWCHKASPKNTSLSVSNALLGSCTFSPVRSINSGTICLPSTSPWLARPMVLLRLIASAADPTTIAEPIAAHNPLLYCRWTLEAHSTTQNPNSKLASALTTVAADGDPTDRLRPPPALASFFVLTPCSSGLSTTSHQNFSLRRNQPPVLFSQTKSAPPTSQTNRLLPTTTLCWLKEGENDWRKKIGRPKAADILKFGSLSAYPPGGKMEGFSTK